MVVDYNAAPRGPRLSFTPLCYAEACRGGEVCNLRANTLMNCRAPTTQPLRNGSLRFEKRKNLASVNHSVAQVDQREQAHFHEEELGNKAKAAKKKYEAALRFEFFGIPE